MRHRALDCPIMRMSREIMDQNKTLGFPGINHTGIEYAYNIILCDCR